MGKQLYLIPEDVVDDICKVLRRGGFAETAFDQAGIKRKTYYRWISWGSYSLEEARTKGLMDPTVLNEPWGDERYVKFATAIRLAEAEGENNLVGYIHRDAKQGGVETKLEEYERDEEGRVMSKRTKTQKPPDPRSAMFLLERKHNARWASKKALDIKQEVSLKSTITLHSGSAPRAVESKVIDQLPPDETLSMVKMLRGTNGNGNGNHEEESDEEGDEAS